MEITLVTANDSHGVVRGGLSRATDKEFGARHGKRGDTEKGSKRRRFDRYGDKITGSEQAVWIKYRFVSHANSTRPLRRGPARKFDRLERTNERTKRNNAGPGSVSRVPFSITDLCIRSRDVSVQVAAKHGRYGSWYVTYVHVQIFRANTRHDGKEREEKGGKGTEGRNGPNASSGSLQ